MNLLPLAEGERINAILPISEYLDNQNVFMATAKGTVKKVALTEFSRPRSYGIIAIELTDDDRLIGVILLMVIKKLCYLPMQAKSFALRKKKSLHG